MLPKRGARLYVTELPGIVCLEPLPLAGVDASVPIPFSGSQLTMPRSTKGAHVGPVARHILDCQVVAHTGQDQHPEVRPERS
jgi:hypothetical protein